MNEAKGDVAFPRALLWMAGIVSVSVFFMAMCGLVSSQAGVGLIIFMLMLDALALWYALASGVFFVLSIERRFTGVCKGLGFVGEAVDTRATIRGFIRTIFHNVFVGGFQTAQLEKKVVYPKLIKVQGSREAWEALINPLMGQKLEDYSKNVESFRLPYDVPFLGFEEAGRGLIRVHAGRMPVPEPFEYEALPVNGVNEESAVSHNTGYRGSGLLAAAHTVSPAALFAEAEVDARALLQAVPMAIDIDGRVWHMPIEGKHILTVARSGGGKGSIVWSLVLRLKPAWELGLVRFWGCDPKRLELAIGREWWAHYADTDVSMVELLEEAVSEMYKVGDQLKGNARCFTPSRKTPLNVVVIDELGYLSSLLGDRKLQTRADNAIRQLLNQGRSNSFSIVACVQDPRKSVVDFRDSFHIRIAGGLDNADMVDLVLGKGMWEAGAKAELIPHGRAGAGCAYVLDAERTNQPRLVRAAWVSDSTIKNALSPAVRAQAEAYEAQDEYIRHTVPQLGLDGKPLGQFRFRVE